MPNAVERPMNSRGSQNYFSFTFDRHADLALGAPGILRRGRSAPQPGGCWQRVAWQTASRKLRARPPEVDTRRTARLSSIREAIPYHHCGRRRRDGDRVSSSGHRRRRQRRTRRHCAQRRHRGWLTRQFLHGRADRTRSGADGRALCDTGRELQGRRLQRQAGETARHAQRRSHIRRSTCRPCSAIARPQTSRCCNLLRERRRARHRRQQVFHKFRSRSAPASRSRGWASLSAATGAPAA